MFSVKAIVSTVVCSGLIVSLNAQINLNSSTINFRNANSAMNSTYHFGDFHLDGGTGGTSWGWLYANAINCAGWETVHGDLSVTANTSLSGNVDVYGNFHVWTPATKNFIQPHPTDTTKAIQYTCIEAGEVLTMARGLAKTVFGIATINLPEHFGLVTSDASPLTVLLTPENAPVLLYTVKKTKSQIDVKMKQSDFEQFGDAEFCWQITGVRDGFENQDVIVDIDNNGNINESKAISEKNAIMIEKVKKIIAKRTASGKKERNK